MNLDEVLDQFEAQHDLTKKPECPKCGNKEARTLHGSRDCESCCTPGRGYSLECAECHTHYKFNNLRS